MDNGVINRFLNKIKNIESSGGKNTDHPTIQSGIHAGTAAVGNYGLMPNTIEDIINRKKRQDAYGPDEAIINMLNSGDQIKDFVQTQPRIERNLASDLAKRVLTNQNGDEERAAYSWNQGSNLRPDDIEEEELNNSNYIKKFRRLKELLGE